MNKIAESFFSSGDKAVMKNFLLGGAATGLSLASLTSLLNYLKSNNRDSSSDDDDTMYVRLKKTPMKTASVATGLGIAGAGLSALTTYALTKKIYKELRKREAQKKLDNAQEAMIAAQGYEKASSSGRPLSFLETLSASPVALASLLAISSGVASNLALQKAFPQVKNKTPKPPRRVVVVDDEDSKEKVASIDRDAAYETMLLLTASMKSASSDVYRLISCVAGGGLGNFIAEKEKYGFGGALDRLKSASYDEPDTQRMALACACIARHPAIAEQAQMLQAMEFAGDHPAFTAKAAALSDEEKKACFCVLSIVGESLRAEIMEPYTTPATKSAGESSSINVGIGLAALLKQAAKETPTTDLSGDEGGVSGQSASRKKYVFSRKTTKNMVPEDRDFIDDLLNPSTKPEDADTHSMR